MNLFESFGLSVFFFEVIIPVSIALFGFLVWFFGDQSIEHTVGILKVLFGLIANSAIPWWINPINWALVILVGIGLFIFSNSNTHPQLF